MTNAKIDENGVHTMIGVKNTDGTTIMRIVADPNSHLIKLNDSTTGTDLGPKNAVRDENGKPTLLAVSADDGITPISLYVDENGYLLVDSS